MKDPQDPRQTRQLLLFPWINPMTERLGRQFFLSLPASPGVYLMRDRNNHVLYVGQSRNLKQRLAAYRFAHPDHASRKVIRMIGRIHRLKFATCRTVEEALLLENRLIRLHRPQFNSLNSHPESNLFVALSSRRSGVELSYSRHPDGLSTDPQRTVFGAFRSSTTRRGLAGLCRLCWFYHHPTANRHDLPIHLNRKLPPRPYTFSFHRDSHRHNGRLKRKLWDFFEGKSPALLNKLCGKSDEVIMRIDDPWLRRILLRDHLAAARFYHFGSARNRTLKLNHRIRRRRAIAQAQLDDLIATSTASPRSIAPPFDPGNCLTAGCGRR